MAQVGKFNSNMPKMIITLIRMPSWKPLNRKLAIIKCRDPTPSGISKGKGGGQTQVIEPMSNNGSPGSSKSENNSDKTNGVGGGTPKKTTTTN